MQDDQSAAPETATTTKIPEQTPAARKRAARAREKANGRIEVRFCMRPDEVADFATALRDVGLEHLVIKLKAFKAAPDGRVEVSVATKKRTDNVKAPTAETIERPILAVDPAADKLAGPDSADASNPEIQSESDQGTSADLDASAVTQLRETNVVGPVVEMTQTQMELI